MTRKILTAFFVLGMTVFCYAQEKNEVRVYGGRYVSDTQKNLEIGIKYLRNITENLRVETGILLAKANAEITTYYDMPDKPDKVEYEDLKVLQIPLYANYIWGKYFFVNGGLLLSFDKSKGSLDSQSGIGYGVGVGAKYTVKKIVFYLNPNFKRCAAFIPFQKEKHHEKFTELGVEFGIGYRF